MGNVIAIGLSPNTNIRDVLVAFGQLCMPWRYQRGEMVLRLEQWFRQYFTVPSAVACNSGRSALYTILVSLGIQKGDEIILQAFTCSVVPNALIAAGAMPIYCDIRSDGTIDPSLLQKHITKKTKAILVQHTFGIPADMASITALAKKHKLFVIEDVAHTIGGLSEEKKLGLFGDVSFFSFGRDKAFSSVFGGMIITKDKELGKKIRAYMKAREYPSFLWIFQQLLHPLSFAFILPLYEVFGIGKALLVGLQKLQLLSFPVAKTETQGAFFPQGVRKMPNALAALALMQLRRLREFNRKRQNATKQYQQAALALSLDVLYPVGDACLLRFPLIVKDAKDMIQFFRKHHIYLGDWYTHTIDPKDVVLESVYYKKGMCPVAESLEGKIVNIPTYPMMKENDIKKVLKVLSLYVSNSRN